jgi:hypothetical protein
MSLKLTAAKTLNRGNLIKKLMGCGSPKKDSKLFFLSAQHLYPQALESREP